MSSTCPRIDEKHLLRTACPRHWAQHRISRGPTHLVALPLATLKAIPLAPGMGGAQ